MVTILISLDFRLFLQCVIFCNFLFYYFPLKLTEPPQKTSRVICYICRIWWFIHFISTIVITFRGTSTAVIDVCWRNQFSFLFIFLLDVYYIWFPCTFLQLHNLVHIQYLLYGLRSCSGFNLFFQNFLCSYRELKHFSIKSLCLILS